MYTGRLAPSPTGLLHLGHARTFAVAAARAAAGRLYLRVDDLDPDRSRPEYIAAFEQDLRWLGLTWQGEPVYQSARSRAYRNAWEALVASGWVYPCRCSRKQLRAIPNAPHEGEGAVHEDEEPVYPGTCRPAWEQDAAEGAGERQRWLAAGPDGQNWRFRVPQGAAVRWSDQGRGPKTYVAGVDFGDFGVWRRDGVAAYQLATVVDDAAMKITEVVRGEDLLLSTARQILLFRALGHAVPDFYHCALVRDAEGRRLAKRTDALSIAALRSQGFTASEVLAMAAAGSPRRGTT